MYKIIAIINYEIIKKLPNVIDLIKSKFSSFGATTKETNEIIKCINRK